MTTCYTTGSSTSSSMAAATTGLLPRVQISNISPSFLGLPRVSCSSLSVLSQTTQSFNESTRFTSLKVKASSTDESSIDVNEIFDDLKEKWDNLENKSTVLLYGGGAIVAIWLSSTIVGAINSVPLLPKILELVGLGYTGWFVYRYLLFKSSRKELAEDIESLKKKIAGTD